MTIVKKIEYSLKAGVAGAALGLAACGLLSFIPAVTVSLGAAEVIAAVGSVALSTYTFATA